jgi:excisionase family DNA binding protein
MLAPKLVSIKEAALILGVPRGTLYHWTQHGTVPVVRIGGRRLVPIDAVQAIVRGEAA